MTNAALIKKSLDAEFIRRYNQLFFAHATGLLPLFVFVAVTLLKCQALVWTAVYLSGLAYALSLLGLRLLWRRAILISLQKEGVLTSDYRPPAF
ncbi:hypothetical protein R0137_09555 [Congregibacter brevis]|uniref:Uncharacterized protein n=1 Tax=Congregibacter brevis TaxID=3081201 RepID=A0ABZ0I865_9GAMM|nr:hypothetical protein R0137_09555 [Congregibacter sp. IMCC45268]